MTLNRFLNNQNRYSQTMLKLQIDLLNKHELKVSKIMDILKVYKKELHFAFMFASPLVVQKSKTGFKYFP